ncbi:MAG: malate permease [Abditibacteriota bacterium]|nr:malate permease [Abditibacteriota bacterium]
MNVLEIALRVIVPIFLMMGVGFALQKKFNLDIKTLTRLNFWVFVPALLWVKIVESNLSAPDFLMIGAHFVLLFASMFALAWFGAGAVGAPDRLRRAITASVLFYNSGNYGIPVAQLAFATSPVGLQFAVAVQAIVMMLQNVTNFTIGLALHAGGRPGSKKRETLGAVFKLPMIYTLIGAWTWRFISGSTGWALPFPIDKALHYLADGLVPIALITLGAQMATLKSPKLSRPMVFSLVLRLAIGPVLSGAIVCLLGIQGALAQSLVISTSFPTAVNSALLAMEFDNEPEFAAAVVFYSTLFSAVTVSVVIFAAKVLW